MVHQHFRLVAPMTVAENIHLGWDATPPRVTRRELVARTDRLMDQFGLRVDPEAKIWQLSVGEQQRVEILRMLARGARDPDPRRADGRAHHRRGAASCSA